MILLDLLIHDVVYHCVHVCECVRTVSKALHKGGHKFRFGYGIGEFTVVYLGQVPDCPEWLSVLVSSPTGQYLWAGTSPMDDVE